MPQECLILTMKANQKYFPLLDAPGKLTTTSSSSSATSARRPSRVIGGNERVVRPRLADAKFFFDQDRRRRLARASGLAKVVYHNKLGTQGERVERVRAIASAIGAALGGAALARQADRLRLLAKADLLTDMVGEFPELQGIMGGYYARHDGRPTTSPRHRGPLQAALCRRRCCRGTGGRHWWWRWPTSWRRWPACSASARCPPATRIPFALRRHALGVIRMLIERAPAADVTPPGRRWAFAAFPATHGQAQAELGLLLHERLVGYLREQGYARRRSGGGRAAARRWAEIPAPGRGASPSPPLLPEAAALAAANKRVGNILKKSEDAGAARVRLNCWKEPPRLGFTLHCKRWRRGPTRLRAAATTPPRCRPGRR